MNDLQETLEQIRRKISRYGNSSINEQNTKSTLIQPLLRALGWDVEDCDEVHLEYKQKGKDKPVDYAMMLLRSPCLFFEAKALGQSLDDRKWANQIMGYAGVAGVQWVVLTDGDEYRIYNSHATVPVEQKLFRTVRISDESSSPEKTLWLLSKSQMQERQINRLWDAHFVDRVVKGSLEYLFATDGEPDAAFVRLLHKRIGTLTLGQIRAGLRRLNVQVSCPLTEDLDPPPKSKAPSKSQTRKASKKPKSGNAVSLQQVVEAGLIETPSTLFRKYKGKILEAILNPDGSVTFDSRNYTACSAAAAAARGSVIGGAPATNGWTFWQFRNADDQKQTLDDVRQRFQADTTK